MLCTAQVLCILKHVLEGLYSYTTLNSVT